MHTHMCMHSSMCATKWIMYTPCTNIRTHIAFNVYAHTSACTWTCMHMFACTCTCTLNHMGEFTFTNKLQLILCVWSQSQHFIHMYTHMHAHSHASTHSHVQWTSMHAHMHSHIYAHSCECTYTIVTLHHANGYMYMYIKWACIIRFIHSHIIHELQTCIAYAIISSLHTYTIYTHVWIPYRLAFMLKYNINWITLALVVSYLMYAN